MHIKNVFKKGFSLAEVLVALTVIGVVAAITVPIIHKSADDEITVTKVKKFHSTMANAIRRASADNGPIRSWSKYNHSGGWNETSAETFWLYLKPYINYMNDNCGSGQCYHPVSMKLLNGGPWPASYGTDIRYKKVVLSDGSVMWFRTHNNDSGEMCPSDGGYPHVCAVFWYDVNGDKAPNTLGKDIFVFYLKQDNYTPNEGGMSQEILTMRAHKNPNQCKGGEGWNCAAYILEHGNMDYLDD
ncbi:type II secretion system protein [bacterium]|nr:type II secretion system protein [bacterium]